MTESERIDLGNFSVGLPVRDLGASRDFYERLGFEVRAGDPEQNWLVMQSGAATVGLFQGMLERTVLTFNPGWDSAGNTLPEFTDVRELQRRLRARGIEPQTPADESTTGPASFILTDPDGNPIFIDQHV